MNSTHLRMKTEFEGAVLNAMYLALAAKNREYLRFNEIARLSGFYKKQSKLQRVLQRLERRGWIEKTKPMWSITGTNPNEIISYTAQSIITENIPGMREKHSIYIPEIHKTILQKSGSGLKSRVKIAKKVLRNQIKEYVFYKLLKYPFFFSINNQRVGDVPEGTKRFWKSSVKELFTALKRNRIEIQLPHK